MWFRAGDGGWYGGGEFSLVAGHWGWLVSVLVTSEKGFFYNGTSCDWANGRKLGVLIRTSSIIEGFLIPGEIKFF